MSLSQKDVSRLENENDHLRQENERLMRKNRELEEKNRHLEEIMSQNMNSLPRYRNKVHIKLQHFFVFDLELVIKYFSEVMILR